MLLRPSLVAPLLLVATVSAAALPLVPASAFAAAGPRPATQEQEAAAVAVVTADPSLSALIRGTNATVAAADVWGGSVERPAGCTLEYQWSADRVTEINEVWPLLRSEDAVPEPPYTATTYRLRAEQVTGLRVDVLLDPGRVLQAMPTDGETDFVLREQTWAPLRWVPWFTAHAWVLAPLFVAGALVLMVRAWVNSRAWNRRTPSMTRHDRQFIGQLAVLLFLIVGLLWQAYEGWFAAAGPSIDRTALAPGSLVALPLLLIPPGLFLAALILELNPIPRRGSWGLIAALSCAASAYFLASAVIGVTTNLHIVYYVLLAILTLLAVPRAFSAGKMGWSRSMLPRYG